MATRCEIKVDGVDYAKVYKHWDGYPEATLPWLKSFNKSFAESRGDDPQYKFAQLLRSSAFDCEKFDLDPSDTTGWGVVKFGDDCGTEYTYTLKADGSVEVQEIEY